MEIEGFENYLIYPDGRVFNKKSNRFLKGSNDKDGYKVVSLTKDGNRKFMKIHRLVAIHYIPNPENKREADHLNRDRSDNRIENLRWVNHWENQQNTGMSKNNTSGYKYILYRKRDERWIFQKTINEKKTYKSFKTLEEAIKYRDEKTEI